MEISRQAENHNLDAQSAVNSLRPGGPEALPPRNTLDPHNQTSGRSGFIRTVIRTVKASLTHAKDLICSERINVLLVFAPIGITVGFLEVDPIVDFGLNALAIIPLAVVISTATESIASRLGDTLGALLNVTVGNTAELMIFFVALAKNQIRIVQASLLGSVLVNLLLVLGTTFLAGGLRFKNVLDDRPAAYATVGMLDFGLLVSMFPVAFLAMMRRATPAEIKREVLSVSRGTSIGLIVIYVLYLAFQMRTQTHKPASDQETGSAEAFALSELQRTSSSRYAETPRGMVSFQDATRRSNLSKLHSAMRSPLRWVLDLGKPDPHGQYEAASQSDEAAVSLLRRTTSLEDLETATHRESHEEVETARRSRSVGAKPEGRFHSRHDSARDVHWWDSSSGRRDKARSDSKLERRSSDYLATVNALHSALPPSPPSTPSSSSERSEYHEPTPHQVHSSRQPLSNQESTWRAHSRANPSFRRKNYLMETYEYRRKRTPQSQTPLALAIAVLVVATSIVSVSTQLAVDAIPDIIESWGVSQIFLGFIVLPVVGNAAEHIIAAKLAMRNKMVLAKKVAVESSAQVVLFIMPTVVLIGWIRRSEMSLQFDIFEIACIVVTSVLASILVCRGKGGWKQGIFLHSIFLIVALGALIYPVKVPLNRERRRLI